MGERNMDYDRERVRILKLHEKLAQEVTAYLKGLEFDELTAIESGYTLRCSGYCNPFVLSNESHLFRDANIVTTLTELSWMIPDYLEMNPDVVLQMEYYRREGRKLRNSSARQFKLNVYTNTPMKNRSVVDRSKYGL